MATPLRVGIFFGGPSREREISFAGGRTVYDNLDKRLFAPVPLFVDARRRLIQLDWPYLYKGTIRDFWPPVDYYPDGDAAGYQLSEESLGPLDEDAFLAMAARIGRPVDYAELPDLIDVAFLALHGVGGEDGALQGTLETLGLPYTGSGIAGSAIGMDKALQKRLMAAGGFATPPEMTLTREAWHRADPTYVKTLLDAATAKLGTPLVVRGANQGSSIGVSILREPTASSLRAALDKAFFRERVDVAAYRALDAEAQRAYVAELGDLRHGIGFPLRADGERLLLPGALHRYLLAAEGAEVLLEGEHTESRAILEGFLAGTEVSTIVLRHPGTGRAFALLPTEIVKGGEVFDYRSKYLPGRSRKKTPADLPEAHIEAVRAEAERLFEYFEFGVYARIDGFVGADGRVWLNDPNTTSGMLPSSFFFHQAAEIGLTPGAFLTYLVYASLRERAAATVVPNGLATLVARLDAALDALHDAGDTRRRVAVLLGGYSSERHISVESGRNVFEKLASSGAYAPLPVFVRGDSDEHTLHELPPNLLLKDNADDIRQAIERPGEVHPSTARVREAARALTERYADGGAAGYAPREIDYADLARRCDEAFIALHGRPGEDGVVQRELERVGLSYNGSGYASSQLTIDKYATLTRLREAGFSVTDQVLVAAEAFAKTPDRVVGELGARLGYPMIVKPVDDGCSSAVQKIRTPGALRDFLDLLLGASPGEAARLRASLGIDPKDEVPVKPVALAERLIDRAGADLFLEITGGLMTRYDEAGRVAYEVFEPSEALSTGEVLSLEEKFLAGEGQNITPARFAFADVSYEHVAARVRETLGRAAAVLGVEGYARIDAFVRAWADGRVETIVIEVNSLPGMTPATCIYHQAALRELTPFGFIDGILTFGRERLLRRRSPESAPA